MTTSMKVDLKNIEWGEFLIGNIFLVSTGSLLPKEILKNGKIARITATNLNNGVFDYYQKVNHKNYRELTNFISVSFLGSVFYHPYTASLDMKIHSIQIPDQRLNKYLAEFLVLVFKRTVSIFSYGDQLSSSDLPKKKILLPITITGKPDYAFMKAYMWQKEQEKLEQYHNYIKKRLELLKDYQAVEPLSKKEWGKFELGKLFELSQGKSKGLNHLTKSRIGVNYLGATNLNNGVLCQVIEDKKLIHKGDSIAFIRNGEGSMGYSVYKAESFIATSDISVGYNPKLNSFIGTFITTVADKVRGKYNFGYKRSGNRLAKEKLLLPQTKNQEPDYQYMENYMKQLEYDKLVKYLQYIE